MLGKGGNPFCQKCKAYFINKHSKVDAGIMLKENRKLLLKGKDVADTFNKHFGSIVESLAEADLDLLQHSRWSAL